MSDLAISATLVIVLCLVIAAIMYRNWHVNDFKLNSQARTFAEYVAETMVKQPHLHNDHGFFVEPKLASRAVTALRYHFRRALVTEKESKLVIVYNDLTWTIPVCTPEEYTQHYI